MEAHIKKMPEWGEEDDKIFRDYYDSLKENE